MNRRSFITRLLAAPAAAWAAVRQRKTEPAASALPKASRLLYDLDWPAKSRLCFNCARFVALNKGNWHLAGGSLPYWVCDECLQDIRNCATCGRVLPSHAPATGAGEFTFSEYYLPGGLRLSPASEPVNPMAWPLKFKPELIGAVANPPEFVPVEYIVRYQIAATRTEHRLTLQDVHRAFGVRPVIVADCPSCAAMRPLTDFQERYWRNDSPAIRAHWKAIY